MSSAEEIAELAERGELDVPNRGSGKGRTHSEQAEAKHKDIGGHTRKIVENCTNGERRRKASGSDKEK